MKKYSWNFNRSDEVWYNDPCDTIEECIATAQEENRLDGNEHECVYIGENNPFVPWVDSETILDRLQEEAYDHAGEAADGWYAYDYKDEDSLNDLSSAITEVVVSWLKKHNNYPDFWKITNIKEYLLQED